jgi:carbamate kinase
MTRPKRFVAALGGNALAKRGEPISAEVQLANIRSAVAALAPLIDSDRQLVITHGNGPQVGMLALQAAAGPREGQFSLDILDAESEGMIGHMIELELRNALAAGSDVATLLTQVLVDAADPAFSAPSKRIGPVYSQHRSLELSAERGWPMARDGEGWRRVVASPIPVGIPGIAVIERLVRAGITLICAGGGGIPIMRDGDGRLTGVEAVIDKDLVSALLARELNADHLLLLTDVPGVYLDWEHGRRQLVARAGPAMLDHRSFLTGSMSPKVEAANTFAAAMRKPASIGRLEDAALILAGRAGTTIDPSASDICFHAAV